MTRKFGPETVEGSTSVRYRFYVIKFLESPNVDIEEYVCVPDSWVILVSLHGRWKRQVKVAYPSGESRETTSDRVEREEEPWDEWNIYRAVVTHGTDSYDSARAWIRFNVLNLLSALDFVDTANTEVMDSTSSSGPSGCSNRSSLSSSDESNQRMLNRRPSVSNPAFKFYVVQFKDLPYPKMRISNYVCVLKSWITSGLADIEVENVRDISFEVKVAYPADPREIPLDFRNLPDDPPKEWKSYRAVVKQITGSYYAAKYWIERKIGTSHATVNNDAADMGGNPPTAAPDNSSGSSPNQPSSDLRKFELALAHCISQPGLTVKKICKRPATSAIVDSKKRPKRVEESTAVYNLSSIANTPPIINETSHTQNRSCLGRQTNLIQAYDSKTQSIMSTLRTNSQQIPPQVQAYMNQRDFYQSVNNNRFAAQNIHSTHELPRHPHMWPNGSKHIPAYQGYTYQNPQSNLVNNNRDTNYIACLQNGRNLNSAYHCSRIAQSAPDNAHLFDPREHPQHRPVTNNNSTSCCLLCNGHPSKMSCNNYDLVNRLKIALLKEQMNKRRPPEHSYE